jgi:hypothetical protein
MKFGRRKSKTHTVTHTAKFLESVKAYRAGSSCFLPGIFALAG